MSCPPRCFDLLVSAEPLVVDVTDVTSWRERAERAGQRAGATEGRLERAEARIEALVEQVAVLSRMLFGRSSEKGSAGAGDPQGSEGSGEQACGSGRPGGGGGGAQRGAAAWQQGPWPARLPAPGVPRGDP